MSGLTEDLSRRTWLGWTQSLSTGLLIFIFIPKTLCASYITTIRFFLILLNIMWGFLSRVKLFLFEPWRQKGREDIAPHILNLVTRWVCLFSPTSRPLCLRDTRPQYVMNRRLPGHQDWSRHFGEGGNHCLLPRIEPRFLGCVALYLDFVPTAVIQLLCRQEVSG
jgi:hypothetical protein